VLSAALAAGALVLRTASGAAPPALVQATLEAALLLGAGQSTLATGVSASAAALLKGVLQTMLLARLKTTAAVILLVVALGIGVASVCYGPLASAQDRSAPNPSDAKAGGRPVDPARLERLIGQLGSARFAEREAAARELESIGPPALEALRKAGTNPDAEIRRRAASLIPAIEQRAEIDSLVQATRVHLAFQRAPLAGAVAEFARTSGLPVRLADSQDSQAGRTVTLDTGDTTWWEACDAFCRAAHLVPVRDAFAVQAKDAVFRSPVGHNVGMTLTNGASEALATDYAGAFRIQALPPLTWTDGAPQSDDAFRLVLNVWPEPKLHWQTVQDLRIDRAVDDAGQALRPRGEVKIHPGEGIGEYVAVRLGKGEKPARSLDELAGRVSLRVGAGPRTLAAVDDILQAAGRAAESPTGVYLKIVEVKQGADEVAVHLELCLPPEVIPARKPERLREADLIPGLTNQVYSGLVLLDSDGRAFPPTWNQTHFRPDANKGTPVVSSYTLAYRVRAGQGKPTKLVFYGMRTLPVEVPFRLRNIPLR
jgi:hypothetical protein